MSRKSFIHILLYVLLFIAVVFASIQLSFVFYIDKKIKDHIKEEVTRQTKGEYEVQIQKLTTNILDQSIYIKGVQLKSVKDVNPNTPKYFVSASEINLQDFKLFSFLFKKNLILTKMELVNPSGYIFRTGTPNHMAVKQDSTKFSFYKLLKKYVHSLNVNKIEIKDADIQVFSNKKDTVPSLVSKNNRLNISNLRIDKSTEESGRLFLADSMRLVLNNISYNTPNNLYLISIKQLVASYTDSQVILDSLEVVPNYSKEEFAKKARKQTDRFKISAGRLTFNHINVKSLIERNWFIANSLKIDRINISAYRNKNDVRKYVRAKSVQQLLKSNPIYTVIDSIDIKNARVLYEEVAQGEIHPGNIFFNEIDGVITGFTNDTTLFSKYNMLEFKASGKFMNKGRISVHYDFPLNTEKMVFNCSGKFTEVPFSSINPMLEPNAKVSMRGGVIDSMIFSFHANESGSKGKMKLIYHGLKLEFLNKNNKSGIIQDILSFLSHRLIINEDNPAKNKPARITEINYSRDPSRFIFNYSWKSLLSGIKPVIGIPDNKSKKKKE